MVKKLFSALAISAVCASAIQAETVNISKDGLGDFLIAPLYIARGNICSNITVMNTNETNSILAKVAVREQLQSQEIDFPIFLSPGDVWDGKLCEREDGVYLTSIDDSNHPAIKDILLSGKNITTHSYDVGNRDVDFTKGYVEIYPIAQFNEKSNAKVEKNILVQRWDTLITGDTTNAKLKKDGLDGYSLAGNIAFETKDTTTAELPMFAFKGAHDKQISGSAIAYGADTDVEVLLGKDKKEKMLKDLQNNVISFNYTNGGEDQYINFTFPFGYANDQVRTYQVTVRDMSENKDIKTEVIIFSPVAKKLPTTMDHEVVSLSVKKIISETSNPGMFKKGMIQIKDITNVSDVQLGSKQIASAIPVKVQLGSVSNKNNINEPFESINTISYAPVK